MNWMLTVAASSGFFAGTSGCTLPVIPILFNHLTRTRKDPRWVTVFFTMGLTGVYFLLYAFLGVLSTLLEASILEGITLWRSRLLLVGAAIAWIMAYRTFKGNEGGRTMQFLKRDAGDGYLGALASGFVFGTIISPCNAGFLITGVMPALASSATVVEALAHLAVFSFFMGLPLLLLGWASGTAVSLTGKIKKNMRKLEILSALFLFLAGAYFIHQYTLTL